LVVGRQPIKKRQSFRCPKTVKKGGSVRVCNEILTEKPHKKYDYKDQQGRPVTVAMVCKKHGVVGYRDGHERENGTVRTYGPVKTEWHGS